MNEYLDALERSVKSNHQTFYPRNQKERRSMAIYLAKGIAEGLKGYPLDEVKHIIPTLYGRFHVKQCFDSIGPVVDAEDFNGLIYKIVTEGRENPKAT